MEGHGSWSLLQEHSQDIEKSGLKESKIYLLKLWKKLKKPQTMKLG